MLHLFSIYADTSALKGIVFQKMFLLCDKENHLDIIISNLQNIEKISASWNMPVADRRTLYKTCSYTLEKHGDCNGAFKTMISYLSTFEGSSENDLVQNKIEEEAYKCIILAIKVPTVINFEEVLKFKAIKHLKGV
jgi:hypothetical protein